MLQQGVRYSMMLFMQSLVMAVEEQSPSLYLLAFLSSLATSPMSHLQPAWYYSLFAPPCNPSIHRTAVVMVAAHLCLLIVMKVMIFYCEQIS